MKANVSKSDRFVFWLYQLVTANQGWFMTLLSGFLLGRVTNELSAPHAGYIELLRGMFSIADRPANLLSWPSLVLLVVVPICHRILVRLHARRRYDRVFAALVERHKARAIAPFNALAWDQALSLQTLPIPIPWLADVRGSTLP